MTEQNVQENDQTQPLHTYGPPWSSPQPAQQSTRPTRATIAAIIAGSLLVGGAAGVGGAAAYSALDDSDPVGVARTANSPVISNGSDDPAPTGSVEAVAEQVLPSVVKINVSAAGGSGSGSGIIIGSDGVILTNNHVVEGAAGGGNLTVSFNDGTTAAARVVGTDPLTDLAVIKAEGVSGLTVARLNSSDTLDVGENVVAIGSPFGLEATVTSGIVSALNRPVSAGTDSQGFATTYPAIQTDAAINPGNSGGPLVNLAGEVVGINSSIRTSSGGEGGSIGLGFAIPISKVMPIVEQLRNGETATHARLGVTVGDATSQDGLVTGAQIGTVEGGSAADQAGLQEGDIVTKVGDEVITGSESLVATVRGLRPGDTVEVTFLRNGESRTVEATLDSDEGTPSS